MEFMLSPFSTINFHNEVNCRAMKKYISCIGALLAFIVVAGAQQVPDFSGTYTLKSFANSDSHNSSSSKIMPARVITKVVQDSNSVEVVFRSAGRGTFTCKYSLDGSEIQNAEPDGTPTVEHAEIKGKILVIRSSIKVAGGVLKGVPIKRTEEWELSKDLRILTVRQRIEVQGMHMENDLLTASYLRQ
jgi:hypothetical protein